MRNGNTRALVATGSHTEAIANVIQFASKLQRIAFVGQVFGPCQAVDYVSLMSNIVNELEQLDSERQVYHHIQGKKCLRLMQHAHS